MNRFPRDNSFEESTDNDNLLLELYMEDKKAYIRALNQNLPVFEIEGEYTDETVRKYMSCIDERRLGKEILDPFAGFTSVDNMNKLKCDIFDNREGQTKETSVSLYRNPYAHYNWLQTQAIAIDKLWDNRRAYVSTSF
ncbi:hypothetical protein TVAG_280940 [Trichomonas vaginalis G3]|uniref:Uncharacterized protein n=1 Tax=Trichomonas vaginalis (strain ATCC PRA-98 / G3) TaxID=412133 RepID=A2DRL4_TRIV3|nr:hypothetical protein TVAGG3_0696790 [Trichomonas vaginalis G3]EAY16977.1 hypothetical protein TVAG_280940 [Trichomonas vaginalis G3]KAI5508976.1 hypothetical protein TVAGG3_0696790 [Trichomonas vaginalis G3]|eukprot:XP_001329200.1 hypothetical protein [Trichomonas vaginalis G3]